MKTVILPSLLEEPISAPVPTPWGEIPTDHYFMESIVRLCPFLVRSSKLVDLPDPDYMRPEYYLVPELWNAASGRRERQGLGFATRTNITLKNLPDALDNLILFWSEEELKRWRESSIDALFVSQGVVSAAEVRQSRFVGRPSATVEEHIRSEVEYATFHEYGFGRRR